MYEWFIITWLTKIFGMLMVLSRAYIKTLTMNPFLPLSDEFYFCILTTIEICDHAPHANPPAKKIMPLRCHIFPIEH